MVTTVSVFILATVFGLCVPVIEGITSKDFANDTINYFCTPNGLLSNFDNVYFTEYYNDMATLVFNPEEDSIKQLFHQNGNYAKVLMINKVL